MKRTPRGFAVYAEFRDSYDSEIRVQESSSAEGPHVWIFCHNERWGHTDPPAGNVGAPKDFTPHLSVKNARRLRSALDAFIRHATPARGRPGGRGERG